MRDFSKVKRVVVKVGTNLLSSKDGIDEGFVQSIADQVSALVRSGKQVLLVSSGAIGMGAKELGLKTAVKLMSMRQACASIGQPLLMTSYRKAFRKNSLKIAQILITRADLNNRRSYNSLRASIATLLELGVVPIFNENDTISTGIEGTAFIDNDRMSALVASKVDAQVLILLTDIDGFYTADPKKDKDARKIDELEKVGEGELGMAGGAGSTFSTGGMKTKLVAAQIASNAGCDTVIAYGKEDNVLSRILDGEDIGTLIRSSSPLSQRARWILNNTHQGSIYVDDGARTALLNHKSLLAIGISKVEGTWQAGEVVQIVDSSNHSFAKAEVSMDSTRLQKCLLNPERGEIIFRPEHIVFLDSQK